MRNDAPTINPRSAPPITYLTNKKDKYNAKIKSKINAKIQNHPEMEIKSRKKLNQAAPFPLSFTEKAPTATIILPRRRKIPMQMNTIPNFFKVEGLSLQRIGRVVETLIFCSSA